VNQVSSFNPFAVPEAWPSSKKPKYYTKGKFAINQTNASRNEAELAMPEITEEKLAAHPGYPGLLIDQANNKQFSNSQR